MFGFQQQVIMDSGPVIQNLTVDIFTSGTMQYTLDISIAISKCCENSDIAIFYCRGFEADPWVRS